MEFKLKLKEIRKEKGLSQKDLADKLEITQMMISKYEVNTKTPSLERLVEIASILGVTLDELVEFNKVHEAYSKKLSKKITNNRDK